MNKTKAIFQLIARNIPNLELKLKQADIKDTPDMFIRKNFLSATYVSLGGVFFLWLVLAKLVDFANYLFLLIPVVFIMVFFYLLKIPDTMVLKKERELNSEIVFAGRFLIIEIESGVPLYDAFHNISLNYPNIGRYFYEITTKVDLGTQMEDAINETIAASPSANLRKVLWQVVNSLHTGADTVTALKSVVEQITKEQLIEISEYGRKLNPLAMFYMIIAVILPSIGITMFIVLSTFVGLNLDLVSLLAVSFFLGVIQFMFLAMIKSSRPSVEL